MRGSWTDGHNQNLIPGNTKIKATSAVVEWKGFTGPEEKGEGEARTQHNPQAAAEKCRGEFRSNRRCRLLPLPPPDVDAHPLLDFLFRVFNINRPQFCTQYVEWERSYAVYAYVCMCVRLRFLASPAFFYGTRSSNFDLDDCRVQSMKDRRSFTIGRPRIWLALTGAFTASSPVRPNYSPRCRQLVELRPHAQVPSTRT